MTEKRFEYVEFTKNVLSFDDNGVCKFFNEQEFEDWLNEQDMEIQLLKKQMRRLYNYFMDWHSDEMGANQFSEMWDMVKEEEKWDYGW